MAQSHLPANSFHPSVPHSMSTICIFYLYPSLSSIVCTLGMGIRSRSTRDSGFSPQPCKTNSETSLLSSFPLSVQYPFFPNLQSASPSPVRTGFSSYLPRVHNSKHQHKLRQLPILSTCSFPAHVCFWY